MILIIEDDDLQLTYLKKCAHLAFPAMAVETATNAVDAIQIARNNAAELRLVILDVHMPIIDGRVAALALRRISPQAWVLPSTGDARAVGVFAHLNCADVLMKPYPPIVDICAIIQRLVKAAPPEPLDLSATDPAVQIVEIQINRILEDRQRQPQVFEALLSPWNAHRRLVTFPEATLNQMINMLREVFTKFGGNRMIGRVADMLSEGEQDQAKKPQALREPRGRSRQIA